MDVELDDVLVDRQHVHESETHGHIDASPDPEPPGHQPVRYPVLTRMIERVVANDRHLEIDLQTRVHDRSPSTHPTPVFGAEYLAAERELGSFRQLGVDEQAREQNRTQSNALHWVTPLVRLVLKDTLKNKIGQQKTRPVTDVFIIYFNFV